MITGSIGPVDVNTTSGRGLTSEELARQCVDKILLVSETAPEPLRAQAVAFQNRIQKLVEIYLKQAVQSDRTTVYNALRDAGHPELAQTLKEL